MSLKAKAFLAIWHDIDPASLAEWNRWHTVEHMPERVGIPGFLAGRRYMNMTAASHVCFTIYEGDDLAVFNSPAYLERLNAPTEWTRRMSPAFRNFVRGACRCIATKGMGSAGDVLTLRYNRDPAASAPSIDATALVERALEVPGIAAAHVGQSEQSVTKVDTNERATRSASGETRYDAVAIFEAIGPDELNAARRELAALANEAMKGHRLDGDEVYALAYLLRKSDL